MVPGVIGVFAVFRDGLHDPRRARRNTEAIPDAHGAGAWVFEAAVTEGEAGAKGDEE